MSLTPLQAKAFKAIQEFCVELHKIFKKQQRSLDLYVKLVQATTLASEKIVIRHLDAFRAFCVKNREAFQAKDLANLEEWCIVYNREKKIFINFKPLLASAAPEILSGILGHLLVINLLLAPSKENKDLYTSTVGASADDGKAGIMDELLGMIAPSIDQSNPDPLAAIGQSIKSGGLQKIIGRIAQGYQDKSLDMNSLISSAQKTFSKAGVGNEQFSQIISSVTNVANSIDSNPDMIRNLVKSGDVSSIINGDPELKKMTEVGVPGPAGLSAPAKESVLASAAGDNTSPSGQTNYNHLDLTGARKVDRPQVGDEKSPLLNNPELANMVANNPELRAMLAKMTNGGK